MDIPDKMLDELDSIAKRESISRAEAVRRAIAEFMAERGVLRTDEAFGIWKSRNIDALQYEDSLRGEWSR